MLVLAFITNAHLCCEPLVWIMSLWECLRTEMAPIYYTDDDRDISRFFILLELCWFALTVSEFLSISALPLESDKTDSSRKDYINVSIVSYCHLETQRDNVSTSKVTPLPSGMFSCSCAFCTFMWVERSLFSHKHSEQHTLACFVYTLFHLH